MDTIYDLYLRISLDKKGEALGVERQETECRARVSALGGTVGRVFIDNDLSATSGVARPAFEELLASKPANIMVWHIDRLIRLTSDLERVISLGVNVMAVTAGHLDLSNPAGRAVARTITAWSTYEGEQKAERQRAAARQRATAGKQWWMHRPFGLEMDGTLRKPEADALAAAYEGLLAGVSIGQLARDLNAAGFTTNRGKPWSQPSLREVLANPRNAAIRTYKGEEVGQGGWEPVVSAGTYRKARRLLDSRARKRGGGGPRRNLLTGVAVCGVCHGTVKAGGKSAGVPLYVCKGGCLTHRVPWVDRYVGQRVVYGLQQPEAAPFWEGLRTGPDDDALHAEADDLRERLSEWTEMFAAREITRNEFTMGSSSLRERLKDVEDTLARFDPAQALSGLSAASIEQWWQDGADMDRQRGIITAVLESITLLPMGRGMRTLKPGKIIIKWADAEKPPLAVVSG